MVRSRQTRHLALALSAALFVDSTHASEMSSSEREARFSLFNSCETMRVHILDSGSRGAEIGLTEESLLTALESRLRGARLYDGGVAPVLAMNVNVSGAAFNIELEYARLMCHTSALSDECGQVFDPELDLRAYCGFVPTWGRSSTGTHSGDAGFIRSSVVELIDAFLVEYLKANEEACSGN